MRSISDNWSGGAKVPGLNSIQWNLLAIPAAVLVVMAILQIISFGRFKDWLDSINIGWPAAVAVVIIIAELWGALSLLRIPMNFAWRYFGAALAVLVSGFWFVENAYLASSSGGQLPTSGYFGKYLNQQPGWWTLIEVTILLFWIAWSVELFKLRPNNR